MSEPIRDITCDIAIIGGSLGGCSAAGHLHDYDHDIILSAADDWVGGQVSSQGVSALDEHAHIEVFGGTRRYHNFRDAIRRIYQTRYDAPPIMEQSVLGEHMPLNPGNGWVSRLCFLPEIGHQLLYDLATDAAAVYLSCEPVRVEVEAGQIQAVVLRDETGEMIRVRAAYYLDATDTGDLLPLAQIAYVTGAESQASTDEPHAAADARPDETQGFTYCFAVEYRAGEDHTIEKPDGYEQMRMRQPFTLSPEGRDGERVVYAMFDNSWQGNPPFWTYRRIHDGTLLGGNDISLINWVSNDYHGGNILDAPPAAQQQYLDEAKRLSLGFLYWLQTECPRDDGGTGYPELKLRRDIMDTGDGLSKQPYIRESRRIVPLRRIVEQDITADTNSGARAAPVRDSVGIGWYAMDLHPCVGNPGVSMYAPTRPFQIPLGALIPQQETNLIPACKNIGTTHLTNGAYRLHPVEWAIGEAAAAFAAFCVAQSLTPHRVHADDWLIWRLQYQLVKRGCPLVWAIDVPLHDPLFVPTQLLLVRDIIVPESDRWHRLTIGMDDPLGHSIAITALQQHIDTLAAAGDAAPPVISPDMTWRTLCWRVNSLLDALQ